VCSQQGVLTGAYIQVDAPARVCISHMYVYAYHVCMGIILYMYDSMYILMDEILHGIHICT